MKSSEAPTVAYLRYADKYCGPLLCRLKGVNQSVIRSHSEFSPRLVENLGCLYAIEVPKRLFEKSLWLHAKVSM